MAKPRDVMSIFELDEDEEEEEDTSGEGFLVQDGDDEGMLVCLHASCYVYIYIYIYIYIHTLYKMK